MNIETKIHLYELLEKIFLVVAAATTGAVAMYTLIAIENREPYEPADLTPVITRLDSVLDRIERLEMEQGLEPMPYRGQYGGRWNEAD